MMTYELRALVICLCIAFVTLRDGLTAHTAAYRVQDQMFTYADIADSKAAPISTGHAERVKELLKQLAPETKQSSKRKRGKVALANQKAEIPAERFCTDVQYFQSNHAESKSNVATLSFAEGKCRCRQVPGQQPSEA